ncbi:arf-GAP with dual PH domain-containing protein 1 isoform X4 [Apus apus]|uniref:arf-GAP with dual PH domain-containing protein 1 isoform X4 n=1 Tax=Apus apus TaxID=8895 RepID=UPI0021F8FED1|nr:arf-GAP with dual PH domain-containing protein 1 isoform X4 [Apus apus]
MELFGAGELLCGIRSEETLLQRKLAALAWVWVASSPSHKPPAARAASPIVLRKPKGSNLAYLLLQRVLLECCCSDPDWASHSLGIFICLNCSGIHRNIPQVSKVKSVRLDDWDDAQVEFMASNGNNVAKAKYESKMPPFYYKPTFLDCQLLREQWIRAKYERKEFIHSEKQEPYSAGYREGFLWKRGRDNGQFLSRKFVLSEREGALKYFNKNDAKEPKAIMKIEHLNATFQPAKIGNPHGLQITYLKDNSTRNIFVYHEDGKEGCRPCLLNNEMQMEAVAVTLQLDNRGRGIFKAGSSVPGEENEAIGVMKASQLGKPCHSNTFF